METYSIKNLTFIYSSRRTEQHKKFVSGINRESAALNEINLSISQGEFITIAGTSGCGKTTLLRHLKPGAEPYGTKLGEIYFEGTPLENLSARDSAAKIGYVFQSVENQIVTDKVWHELAFGLESLGFSTSQIRLRVAEIAAFFGIETWFYKSVTELSGGQKQLLLLASVMAMQPSVLILDEPTSQLDPIAAGEFLAMVSKINRELGVTIILTEHKLDEALALSDRAVFMDKGRIIAEGTPEAVGIKLLGENHNMFKAMPVPMRVWAAFSQTNSNTIATLSDCPITLRDGAKWLAGQNINAELLPKNSNILTVYEKPAISLEGTWFKYDKNSPDVIKDLSFTVHYGELTAIVGGNGTGKTTALSLLAGLNAPYRGKVSSDSKVFMLPQNPQSVFAAKTLKEDLLDMLSEQSIDEGEKQQKLADIIKLCHLSELLDSHPYDLSGGEQQRAALAKVLLNQPKILLLDEPTKGFDANFKEIFAAILSKLKSEGVAIVIVSHDVEFVAEYADSCSLLFDGSIVAENTARAFFKGNSFYTTAANRMARKILPEAVTAHDIILALNVDSYPKSETAIVAIATAGLDLEIKKEQLQRAKPHSFAKPVEGAIDKKQEVSQPRFINAQIASIVFVLLTIPLTILIGSLFFDDRRFAFISVLIILQVMLPFFFLFEKRKPKAREIVTIAALCAITVAGRGAFFMLPQFKPVIALIIISAVALGPQSGFLIGAMSAFISNIFFGQGPWTPWQMFAFGLIGFLAGLLFGRGRLSSSPPILSVYGAIATFFIFGGIMNPATVLMFQPNPTIEMFLLSYLHGLPFDLIHTVATVVFLMLLSAPMLEKLERIKTKYGLME